MRQSDAHAWTEVWLPHEGWLRIDPTSAVAPSRTEQLQRLSPPTSAFGGAMDQVISPDVLRRLRANWEALNHRWNDWVLNYTPRDQSALLQRLGANVVEAAAIIDLPDLGGSAKVAATGTPLYTVCQYGADTTP